MVKKTPNSIEILEPVTPNQVERARQTCAAHAKSPEDLALLLEALGIGPGWRETWTGPILADTII